MPLFSRPSPRKSGLTVARRDDDHRRRRLLRLLHIGGLTAMRVALALSGGGIRAAAFHCGVSAASRLGRLLESTTFVSTVSGGSLVVGLILLP